MNHKYLQNIIKNLREYYKCPSCGTNYFFEDIKILGQMDTYCFVQLSCHGCSMPVLATVSVGEVHKPYDKTMNDLSLAEEDKFARMGNISPDEIASFHKFISSFRGHLSDL